MAHSNRRFKQSLATDELHKSQETQELERPLGIVAGIRIRGSGKLMTPDVCEMLDAKSKLILALREMRPQALLSHPNHKDYYLRPAYVEENRAITKSKCEKLPFPQQAHIIHQKEWKELKGGSI